MSIEILTNEILTNQILTNEILTNEIKEYLDSLPSYIQTINLCDMGLFVLPDLSRFTNLQYLHCSHNNLTYLPKLNETLLGLYCDNNKLTSLPELDSSLTLLYCCDNELTCLPKFNKNLLQIFCTYNKLTCLPEFDPDVHNILLYIDYHNNPVCDTGRFNGLLGKNRKTNLNK